MSSKNYSSSSSSETALIVKCRRAGAEECCVFDPDDKTKFVSSPRKADPVVSACCHCCSTSTNLSSSHISEGSTSEEQTLSSALLVQQQFHYRTHFQHLFVALNLVILHLLTVAVTIRFLFIEHFVQQIHVVRHFFQEVATLSTSLSMASVLQVHLIMTKLRFSIQEPLNISLEIEQVLFIVSQ